MTMQEKTAINVPVQQTALQRAAPESVWEPLARVRGEFDRLFDDFWHRPMGVDLNRRIQALTGPALELKDKGDAYELIAEVPGMKPEEIDLKVTDNILRLSGEKKEEIEEKKEGYLFSERRYGHFERAVELPRGIDQAKIKATARDGVLSIQLPKSPEAMQRERKIQIGT
jgi:HSP20 family protein